MTEPTLKECRTCYKPVAKKAKTCPHCGQDKPGKVEHLKADPIRVIFMLGVVAWVIYVWNFGVPF